MSIFKSPIKSLLFVNWRQDLDKKSVYQFIKEFPVNPFQIMDRQTDRWTETQTDRQRDRDTDRQTEAPCSGSSWCSNCYQASQLSQRRHFPAAPTQQLSPTALWEASYVVSATTLAVWSLWWIFYKTNYFFIMFMLPPIPRSVWP